MKSEDKQIKTAPNKKVVAPKMHKIKCKVCGTEVLGKVFPRGCPHCNSLVEK